MNRTQVGLLIVGAIYITIIVLVFGAMERRIISADREIAERKEQCK